MENLDALNSFLGENDVEKKSEEKTTIQAEKKEVIKQKDGLVERFDKVYVTNDGRQLLREVY